MTKNRAGLPAVHDVTIHDVTIGALLHDIGKLMQRGSDQPLTGKQLDRASDILPVYKGRHSHWHALWTDAFFDWTEGQELLWPKGVDRHWVRDLAVYHHRPLQAHPDAPGRIPTELVTVADRLASGFERKARDEEEELSEEGRNAFRRRPLKAIMPSLRINGLTEGLAGHHLPGILDADGLMPQPELESREIGDRTICNHARVWRKFQNGWKKLVGISNLAPDQFEEGIVSLMERWLWAVPSSTIDEPDVSLFDHSRVVAAFAAALFHHHTAHGDLTSSEALNDRMRPKFRFLVGDLSGLQSTLFRFSRERIRGLNRILRGRSLRFELIADAGTRQALQAFDMPWSAALQTAGGRFLLLLPDLGEDEMKSRTDRLRDSFDKWLARNYTGDLGLGLALSEPFAAHDLVKATDEDDSAASVKRAGKVRDDLAVTVETAKLQQLRHPAEQAVLSLDYPHGVCGACGIRPAKRPETEAPENDPVAGYCQTCQAEEKLGRHYPKARMVIIEKDSDGDEIFNLEYRLHKDEHPGGKGWRLREAENGPAAYRPGYCYVPRFSEAEVAKYQKLEDHSGIKADDIKTFEALAGESSRESDGSRQGREMLAVLKADVDRLGKLFATGIGERWSLARAATLSRMIDGYFSIRLPHVLHREFPNIYTVYAGGDDLLLLGPWPDIFAFAARLGDDFSRFSLENPSVTLSAGIALFNVKAPVSTAAREAEARLSEVKDKGRNGISVIEKNPMPWDTYRRALGHAGKLDGFLQDETLSTAALYRFLTLSDSAARVAEDNARTEDYAWKARLGYTLARNLPDHSGSERRKAAFDLVIRLFGLDRGLEGVRTGAVGARLALSHAIYRNR